MSAPQFIRVRIGPLAFWVGLAELPDGAWRWTTTTKDGRAPSFHAAVQAAREALEPKDGPS